MNHILRHTEQNHVQPIMSYLYHTMPHLTPPYHVTPYHMTPYHDLPCTTPNSPNEKYHNVFKTIHSSFSNDGYYCKGNITEWTKCTNVTKDPQRTAWKISSDLKEDITFLLVFCDFSVIINYVFCTTVGFPFCNIHLQCNPPYLPSKILPAVKLHYRFFASSFFPKAQANIFH